MDFVSRRTTAPSIMQCLPQTDGTNLNTMLVLLGITGPAPTRAGRYSRTMMAGQELMYTTINADGAVATTETLSITSDLVTRQQRTPTSTLKTTTSIA